MNNVDYIVLKRTTHRFVCSDCDGSGVNKRPHRKMTFVYDCPKCEGKGYLNNYISEEISLKEALAEINH